MNKLPFPYVFDLPPLALSCSRYPTSGSYNAVQEIGAVYYFLG